MSKLLRISLVANAVLCATVLYLSRHSAPPAIPAAEEAPLVGRNAAEPQSADPFHWRQLESSDYRTYVANLRGIGCPEQTLRDIIVADVDTLYAPRREQLRGRDVDLRKLQTEEMNLVCSLLGLPVAAEARRLASSEPNVRTRRSEAQVPISIPLALQDASSLNLNAEQSAVLAEIRESFLQAIGGPDQNPDDPAYRSRWQRAQPESDEMLRGLLGVQTWLDLESETVPSQGY